MSPSQLLALEKWTTIRVYAMLGTEPRVLRVLGKRSTDRAAFQARPHFNMHLLSPGLEQCPQAVDFQRLGDRECRGVREQEMGSAERKGRSQLAAGQKLWWVICPDHVLTLPARPHALSEGFTRNGCGVLIRSEIATAER